MSNSEVLAGGFGATTGRILRSRTGNFSIEGWVKTSTNGNQVIATKGTNWQLAVTSDAGNIGKARFTYANAAITAYSSGRVDDGNWHHIVAVANRTTGTTVYVDGLAGTTIATANSTALTDTNPVRIGAHATTAGYFTGQIDEIAVYNTAAGALTLSITPDPAAGPISVFDYDEFGTPRGASKASRYGYLGGKQRSSELRSGVIAMGARSYVPALGRFSKSTPSTAGLLTPTTTPTKTHLTSSTSTDGAC